jgi:hypothetical protein
MNNQTYRQKIGTEYEYYVLEHIRKDYEKVWHWSQFPEKLNKDNTIRYKDTKCNITYKKNIQPSSIFINDDGLYEILINSAKKKSNLLLEKYFKIK